jgi:ABC-2 type transport system ATP-binding protein
MPEPAVPDPAATPAPDGPGTARARKATPSKASTTAADRRKRTTTRATAAQSKSDTVRPPRGAKGRAQPAEAPQADDETTEILAPAPAPQVMDDETTEILAPAARPAAVPGPDDVDAPTKLLEPVAHPPRRDGADETTEILPPAAPPAREGADVTTEILAPAAPHAAGSEAPAHVRGQADQAGEPEPAPAAEDGPEVVLRIRSLSKRFGSTLAVDRLDLDVRAGSFAGIVGPNGAGKTTTLSMVTGLLRPDVGTVHVHGIDVWQDPERAKRTIGVLPDALRLFDRLTGAQLLHYSGVLRGLDAATVRERSADLVQAFGLEDATGRMVADYSAGMTKKIALAAAMIHSPRLLVLDEPFESVDPVSAANIIEILQNYVASGGTVVLSSHGMDLIQRVCDHVAIIVGGRVLAAGTTDEVRDGRSLEDRFVELAGGRKAAKGMEWLHSFTD